ncbi:MAG: class I SAM-dependent methyltransferase [Parcubacteria group bacterium]|nr:class I SAM-dependent methyltransferase [Parcubacteria group bacterium]
MKDSYIKAFTRFLSHTDEKEILLEGIIKEIEKYNIKSVLDIGAGGGLLSIPLSKEVNRYLAIEQKEEYVEKLKDAGLEVVHGEFPTEVDESFDMVLASHSLNSYRKGNFESFAKEAFKLVNKGGVLLIITYRGQEDDWTNLMDDLGVKKKEFEVKIGDYNRIGYNTLIGLLNSLGEIKTRKVITKVETDNIEDMVQVLSFVFSYGKKEKEEQFIALRPKLEKILNSQYKNDNGYYFPFQHFFITTKKI